MSMFEVQGSRVLEGCAFLVLAASVAACAAPPAGAAQRDPMGANEMMTDDQGGGESEGELPFAQGRSFATLDEYLAFLEQRGAYDVPWFREIRPGVYEVVTRRPPGSEPQTFTREELMQQFGFTR